MNAQDIELALRSRAAFNNSVERIDPNTRNRLRELRLRVQRGVPRYAPVRWAWPAGAALTATLALAVFLPLMPHTQIAASRPTTIAIVDQPASNRTLAQRSNPTAATHAVAPDALEAADPELLSDLDFYGWLAKQPNQSAAGG